MKTVSIPVVHTTYIKRHVIPVISYFNYRIYVVIDLLAAFVSIEAKCTSVISTYWPGKISSYNLWAEVSEKEFLQFDHSSLFITSSIVTRAKEQICNA